MFQKITDNLINTAKKLDSEKVIMAAPIYLLPQKDYSYAMLRYSLEQLVIELDKYGVISEKMRLLSVYMRKTEVPTLLTAFSRAFIMIPVNSKALSINGSVRSFKSIMLIGVLF